MTPDAIAELLRPFLGGNRLSATQLEQLAAYLDLLLRWNARTNLTAVRDPEHIVSRHFGESLFAARALVTRPQPEQRDGLGWVGSLPAGHDPSGNRQPATGNCADLGSGAGFPGLPLKIWAPSVHVTLIESQNKKATFLREVIRALGLRDAEVYCGRGEDLTGGQPDHRQLVNGEWRRFDLVTLRAVERFESALDAAAGLLASPGRLALLIGAAQCDIARNHARHLQWSEPLPIPLSANRVLLVGTNPPRQEPHE